MRSGTTLIEMLTVLLVISAIASIVLPSTNNFFASQEIAAAGAQLTADIRFARSWAMGQQTYVRLVFSSDKTKYVVQELTDNSTNLPIVGTPETALTTSAEQDYNENPTNWRSIIDDSYREINSRIDLTFTPTTFYPIFFRPDGVLVTNTTADAAPLGILKVKFELKDSDGDGFGIEVEISPAGVLESVAWYDENYL